MALSVSEANKLRTRRPGLAPASNQVFRMGQDMTQSAPRKVTKSPARPQVRRVSGKSR